MLWCMEVVWNIEVGSKEAWRMEDGGMEDGGME